MPEDILPKRPVAYDTHTPSFQQSSTPPLEPNKKQRISALGVIFTIIIAILLINLGHKITFDMNKAVNPKIYSVQNTKTKMLNGFKAERSLLSTSVVYYEPANQSSYLGFKVLIHASFIIPIFLLMFLIYYLINVRQKNSHYKIVSYGYLIFSLWMMVYLTGNLVRLAYYEFPQLVWYLVIIVLVVLFTGLAIFIQKKTNHHNQ